MENFFSAPITARNCRDFPEATPVLLLRLCLPKRLAPSPFLCFCGAAPVCLVPC